MYCMWYIQCRWASTCCQCSYVHVHVYSIHCIWKSVHFINYSNCVIKQKTNPGPERTQAGHRRNKSESTPFPRHCSVVLVFALTLFVLALSSLSSVFPGCHCVVFISILSTLVSTVYCVGTFIKCTDAGAHRERARLYMYMYRESAVPGSNLVSPVALQDHCVLCKLPYLNQENQHQNLKAFFLT